VLRRTLRRVGVAGEIEDELPVPTMRRQVDRQSRAWADRYRREEEARP
jgi:LPS sulfotransferase NodH